MTSLTKTVEIQAAPARVWEVLTAPDWMRVWLSDAEVAVRHDGVAGGAIAFTGDWHGFRLDDRGTLLAVEPERVFAYTYWSSLSGLPDRPEHYMPVRFDLRRAGGGTVVTLAQENLATPEIVGHWNFYWNMALDRIRRLAETGRL